MNKTQNTIALPLLLRGIRKLEFPKKLGLLERIYGASLAKNGIAYVVCANGLKWRLDLNDSCHRWIVYGRYEGGESIDFAMSKLSNGGVYVDSGANIGQWLMYLAHVKGVRTLAFEPVSTEREWLLECIAMQDGWNVDVLPYGLGQESQQVEIQCNGGRSTIHMDWYQGKNLKRENIEIRRLDELLLERNVEQVDFWKLDVEGAELLALKGAENFLAEQRIKTIFYECHPSNYRAIKDLCESHGYKIYDLVGSKTVLKNATDIPTTENLVAMV